MKVVSNILGFYDRIPDEVEYCFSNGSMVKSESYREISKRS